MKEIIYGANHLYLNFLPSLRALNYAVIDFYREQDSEFFDQPTAGWYIDNSNRPKFNLRKIDLNDKVSIAPCPQVNVGVFGCRNRNMFEIAPDGTIVSEAAGDTLDVSIDSGVVTIDAGFLNLNEYLSIGSSQAAPVYSGTGEHLFTLTQLTAWTAEPELDDPLRIIDVGAAGGLQPKWARRASLLRPVLFEPNAAEAARTRELLAIFREADVIETALSNIDGSGDLHVARTVACTSVFKPNADVLDRYGLYPIFETVQTISVQCARYDTLHRKGIVPDPDVIKIDVQGHEYEVLSGFGGLLQNCLGIELEAHLYPLYQGQKLLHDLVDLLDGFGLVLKSIRPVPNFSGDVVEVDAFFTRASHQLSSLSKNQRKKLDILNVVWGLPEEWPRAEQ